MTEQTKQWWEGLGKELEVDIEEKKREFVSPSNSLSLLPNWPNSISIESPTGVDSTNVHHPNHYHLPR